MLAEGSIANISKHALSRRILANNFTNNPTNGLTNSPTQLLSQLIDFHIKRTLCEPSRQVNT